MLVSYIFLVYYFITPLLARHYDCTYNGTVALRFNEIGFFQTSNYPKLLTDDEFSLCNLTFASTENSTTNHRYFAAWWYSFYDDETNSDFANDFEVSTDDLFFAFGTAFSFIFYSCQGFVIFDDGSDKCPLEAISEKQPYHFINENEIIMIQSSYEAYYNRTKGCLWRFSAPDGYGFKITISIFDISPTTIFFVENSTDILLNKRIVPLLDGFNFKFSDAFTHYNGDKWIQISLSSDLNFITEMEFQAYISIVRTNFDKMDGNCSIIDNAHNQWLWTNNKKNSFDGYINNIECSYNLTVVPNFAVVSKVNFLTTEPGDILKCHIYEKNKTIIVRNYDNFMLEPFTNKSEESFTFSFQSDGSMQSLGFELSFTNYTCQCADTMIPCNADATYTVMGNKDGFYCGNLRCNFTLLPCNSSLTLLLLKIYDENLELTHKKFRVISNNNTIWETDGYYFRAQHENDETDKYIYLNPANTNIFEVITFPSLNLQRLLFYVKPFIAPQTVTYIISSTNVSSIIISSDPEKIILIKIAESLKSDNISCTATRNYDGLINVYNNESLTYNLNKDICFTEFNLYECKLPEGQLAIYSPYDPLNYFQQSFVFRLSKNFGGCLFNNNIYLTRKVVPKRVVGIAGTQEECSIIILIDLGSTYYISHMFTTATKQNVKVFVGSEKEKLYFKFNSKTSKKYQSIGLFSDVYLIKIPKNAAALFIITGNLDTTNFFNLQCPFQSFITTPFYGLYKFYNFGGCNVFAFYNITETSVKFTAVDYQMSPEDIFYFEFDNISLRVNKTGDEFIFKNKNVDLCYGNGDRKPPKNGISFFIETINDKKF